MILLPLLRTVVVDDFCEDLCLSPLLDKHVVAQGVRLQAVDKVLLAQWLLCKEMSLPASAASFPRARLL